ncbi:MAG TPA: PQQ-binding-like beta-propeller repeat protein, partial [Amycolatopsis sp.]|nr:PQQ-binding-like beta-propeller repeat protein [Amycolatopsis sp.]
MRKTGVLSGIAAAVLAMASIGVVTASAATAAPPATVKAAAPVPNGSWTTYHHDNAHTGFDSSAPASSGAVTGWVSGAMDETVYAEPLVYNGIVYAATLNNSVYAFDQATGATIWHEWIRAPESSGWSCGNVSPQGILGTPVIDTAAGRIYVATLGSDDVYRLEALSLTTGTWLGATTITTPVATFNWRIEQERGALALANGYVYVPFGGRAGDCGAYHGFVFAVPTSLGTVTHSYTTPGQGAGFWAAGGVVVDDSTGKVFETSGNGTASGCNQGPIQTGHQSGVPVYENDAVVRLSSTLAHEDAFIPDDWHDNWCINDQDLGSATPVLISSTLAFQSGKWGSGFLVNPQALGGLNGQLYPSRTLPYTEVNVCTGLNSDANFGSYAYAAPRVYLGCGGHGLVALTVNTSSPSFSQAWNATGFTAGPPIVAGGIVWAVDTNGGGLYGFDAATGTQVFHSGALSVTHFTTPTEAGSQVFVGSGNTIHEFTLIGCRAATLSASPVGAAGTGTTVTLTASASGAQCTTPQFRFLVNGAVVQAYSTTNTFSWTTTGARGTYHLEVDAKRTGSLASYESYALLTYTLRGCTAAALGASPPSPGAPGATITLTASATCPATPTYRFLVGPTVVQPYGTTNTFGWNTTGLAYGTYNLEVDVRDQGATAGYEAWTIIHYTLAPCSSAGLSSNKASPQNTGSTMVLTASASCPGTPEYRFLVGGSVQQAYGTTNTFTWNSAGKAAGTYSLEVDVRNQGSSAGYEAWRIINFTLVGCGSAGLTTDRPSPQSSGTTIVLTATASCPGTPEYRFLVNGA